MIDRNGRMSHIVGMWPFSKKPAPVAQEAEPKRKRDPLDIGRLPASEAKKAIAHVAEALKYQPAMSYQGIAMDGAGTGTSGPKAVLGGVPEGIAGYFAGHHFIGYQMCAIIAQHWLVDKACTMPARDAIRHGFEINVYTKDGEMGAERQTDIKEAIKRADKRYRLFPAMQEYIRMGRVFGVRVAFFKIDGVGPEFYENPFNIDAVKPGSYAGIVQVDPYWCAPELSVRSAGDPASLHFYEPEWWIIGGRRYHRSHLMVFRNGDIPDLLKPMYNYGGISTPQKIYERVYAAERTANEAPQLAMTKRLTVMKTGIAEFLMNPDESAKRMNMFSHFRDNYGVKVIDNDDVMEQHDTSLADMDAVIMTEFQLVAAASNVPATKLLGTTPKGFNATGSYEAQSYHEELESIQANDLTDIVNRHHQLVMKSEIEDEFGLTDGDVRIEIDWNPVDSPSALDYATINKTKADTDAVLLTTGAIDGLDVRQRLRSDNTSGYASLADIDAPAEGNEGDDLDADIANLIGGLTGGE